MVPYDVRVVSKRLGCNLVLKSRESLTALAFEVRSGCHLTSACPSASLSILSIHLNYIMDKFEEAIKATTITPFDAEQV